MTTAYVLINCKISFEDKVIEELKKINSVKEIQDVFGLLL